jgi:hypothetical protein
MMLNRTALGDEKDLQKKETLRGVMRSFYSNIIQGF